MKSMRYLISFCLIFVMMFSLTGCVSNKQQENENMSVVSNTVTNDKVQDEVKNVVTNEAKNEAPNKKEEVEVVYYHADSNVENIVSDKANVSECTAQSLMDLLYDKKVISEKVTVKSFEENDGKITLDLSSDFEKVISNQGTTGETMILGSVVNTMLKNLDGKTIKITVEGEDIATGHNIYDFDFEFFK